MPFEAVLSRALHAFARRTPWRRVGPPAGRGGALPPDEPQTLDSGVYRALADRMPVSLVVLGATDGRVLRINQQAEAEFGLSRDTVIGQRIDAVFGPAPAPVLEATIVRALHARGTIEEEFTLADAAGPRTIHARLLATPGESGRAEVIVLIAHDVTAERAQQRELADSRARFEQLAAAVDEGMFVTTPERDRYEFISPQAYAVWGVDATDPQYADKPPMERVHADDRPLFESRAERERRLEPVDMRFRIHHPKLGLRWLRLRTHAQRTPCGDVRVYGLVSDVTAEQAHQEELERARAAAEAASQAKSQFMATMSHEIRTPMNGILGMTELLLGTQLAEKQRRFATAVYRSGEALLEIINDILDFSKIEAGKLELAPADFVLRSVVEDTLELLAPRAHEKRLELGFREAPGLPTLVRADALRLRQVVTNLVANAIKFTECGEVVVSLDAERTPQGLELQFSVRDTGIGIEPQTLARLFSSFTQASGGMSRRYGGTGLGLAISKQLVELMGGRIDAESRPGVGSCFRFTLPVQPATEGAQQLDELDELPPMRVLVVEDHQTNRVILENMLQVWGMDVVLAEDGLKALQILDGSAGIDPNFELALVDMHMPGLDGVGLAKALRERLLAPQMKLILLSSVCVPDDVNAAHAAGFDRFIAKPLRRTELRQAIAGVVQAGATGDRLAELSLNHHVLVVEDNGVNQEVIGQMLRRLGARVRMASTAMEGLRALTEAHFDLVLMDIQMPGMDGTEALRWFRRGSGGRFDFRTPPSTPVVAVTANALGGDAERFMDLGFDDYLSKPFRQSQLLAMLKRHLPQGPSAGDAPPAAGSAGPAGVAPTAAPAGGAGWVLPPGLAAVLDGPSLQKLRDLDPGGRGGLLLRVLRTYECSLDRLMGQLVDARTAQDAQALKHVAHTLKSSSASVGALRLSRICADIERVLREPSQQELTGLLDDMVVEGHRLLAALEPVHHA